MQEDTFSQTPNLHNKYPYILYLYPENFQNQDQVLADIHSPPPMPSPQTPITSTLDDLSHDSPMIVKMSNVANLISDVDDNESDDRNTNMPTRKSTRLKHIPKYLEVYDVDLPSHSSIVTAYPISKHLSADKLSPKQRAFIISLSKLHELSTYL